MAILVSKLKSRHFIARHFIAYFGSLFVIAWVVFCFVTPFISQALIGTPTLVNLEPPGAFIWCGCYFLWFTFFCFPITIQMPYVFYPINSGHPCIFFRECHYTCFLSGLLVYVRLPLCPNQEMSRGACEVSSISWFSECGAEHLGEQVSSFWLTLQIIQNFSLHHKFFLNYYIFLAGYLEN